MHTSLSRKVAKGTAWMTAATVVGRVFQLISATILTRLLDPTDFGLMALAMAVIAFGNRATTTGFDSALIQKQDRPERYLNTAWTLGLLRNLLLFSAIYFLAPMLARFFREEQAVLIIRMCAFSFVFYAFRNIGVVFFRKDLRFANQFVFEIVPLAVRLAIVIPLAFVLRSVWALVWAELGAALSVCLVSYGLHPFRPHFSFRLDRATELFRFGIWIFGGSILVMLKEQGVVFFLGRILGVAAVGFFNRAEAFSMIIYRHIIRLIWRVGYPAFAKIQQEPERFANALRSTSISVALVGFPVAGGIFLVCSDFVQLALTDRWVSLIPLIKIFSLQAVLMFLNTVPGIAFQAIGRPSIGTIISFISVLVLSVLIYPLSVARGVEGAAWASFFSVLATTPLTWYKIIRIIRLPVRAFVVPGALIALNTLLMMVSVWALKQLMVRVTPGVFALEVLAGGLVYGLLSFAMSAWIDDPVMNKLRSVFFGCCAPVRTESP